MNNVMRYKGYVAHVTFEVDENILCGTVVNIEDTIHFEGKTVSELKLAFEESVDDYIRFCKERGEKPDKPYSGHLTLRLAPEVHREADRAARILGVSLNAFIARVLELEAKQVVYGEIGTSLYGACSSTSRRTTQVLPNIQVQGWDTVDMPIDPVSTGSGVLRIRAFGAQTLDPIQGE